MLSEIFLPERIGTKRILSKKIISFSIEDKTIRAAVVYVKRSKTIIEDLLEQKIEFKDNAEYVEKAAKAIKKIVSQVKKYDQIKVAIPSSIVIFKELTMPFVDKEKIRMILDYEIEATLPFSIEQAIADFIITKQTKTKTETSSQILVAIVRKEDLKNILEMYYAAGINPTSITIDLFAIYSIYQQIPEYEKITACSTLIDLGSTSTKVTFLQNGQLKLTRDIKKGIEAIAKNMAPGLNLSIQDVLTKIYTQEIKISSQDPFNIAFQRQLIDLFNEVQFTLNSFSLKLNIEEGISKIFLIGIGSQIRGITKFVNNLFSISCELFKCEKLFFNKLFKNKVRKTISNWSNYAAAIGTAAPSPQQIDFELRRKEFTLLNTKLLTRQLVAATIVSLIIFITIGFNGYQQISNLQATALNLENKEMNRLKAILPKDSPTLKKNVLSSVLKDVERLVNEKTEMWAPFTKQKVKPLEVLQELTKIIDKRMFDTTIEEVLIEDIENDTVKVEVDGYFKSKTGNKHFTYFGELEKRFAESKILQLTEAIDARPTDDKGVKFTAKLKIKDME